MFIIRVACITLALSGVYTCKKYEDGPNLSLKSEEARLSRKWQVQAAYYSVFTDVPTNGENQTEQWEKLQLEFKNDKTYQLENYSVDLIEKIIETGTWEFTEDLSKVKTEGVEMRYDAVTNNFISQTTRNHTWRIMRLTKKEFWVWYQNQENPPWMYIKFENG